MSRLLIAGSLVATLFATSAQAQYYEHWHHRGHRGPVIVRESGGWIAPLIGGVIVGSIIADSNAKREEKQVVVVQQPQTVIVTPTENCTAWKEVQTPEGAIYRERTCFPSR